MAERGRGGIILWLRWRGFRDRRWSAPTRRPRPSISYSQKPSGTKLGDDGVDVLAFCPGATRTPNFLATRPRSGGLLSAPLMDPAETVGEALEALGRGPTRIAGRGQPARRLRLASALPRRFLVRIMSRATRRMYE